MDTKKQHVMLDEFCGQCGGKLVRHLVHGIGAHGLSDDNVYTTFVFDICESCEQCWRETGVIAWPLWDLDKIFDRFEQAQINREEFDDQLRAALAPYGRIKDIA